MRVCGINFVEFNYCRCGVVGTKRWPSYGSSSFLLMPDLCHRYLSGVLLSTGQSGSHPQAIAEAVSTVPTEVRTMDWYHGRAESRRVVPSRSQKSSAQQSSVELCPLTMQQCYIYCT